MNFFIPFMLLAAPVGAMAQPLAAFLDAAAQHNVDERLAGEARVRADAEAGQTWGALLPSLTASGAWTHNQYDAVLELPTGPTTSKTVTITPINQLEASIKVEVPLLDAPKWLRTAATAAGADAAIARAHSIHDQVQRQVVSAYYTYNDTKILEVVLALDSNDLLVPGQRVTSYVETQAPTP